MTGDNIGFSADDVFCFGNAVAETGNSPNDAHVTSTDLLLARNNPRTFLTPAGIEFPYDFNRDQWVSTTDVLLARNNQTDFLTALRLLDLSSPEAADASASELAWLHEFEPVELQPPQPKQEPSPAAAAVDKLLATY